MKLIIRKASVRWNGVGSGAARTVTTASGVLNATAFSLGMASNDSSGTNLAELIAAAHAGSFSLALSQELGRPGSTPGTFITTATVTLQHLAAGWRIMNLHLQVVARLPKVTEARFHAATVRATTTCPLSRLGQSKISLNALLKN